MKGLRHMGYAALALLLTVLPTVALAAARVTLEVNTTKLSQDDELRVTVRASGSFDEISELAADGWDLRATGHQQQLSVIGGSMQRTESVMYLATPSRAGVFKLGPVALIDGGEVVAKSDTVTVEVIAPRVTETVLPAERATDLSTYAGSPFFVHPTLSTNQPFVGQPFVVSYALYWSRQRPVTGIRPLGDPNYGKLAAESLHDDGAVRTESVVLAGIPYQRQTTHRDMLVPVAPGPLRLEGPRFRVDALDARTQRIAAPVIDVTVRPIPTEGRPAGFVDGNVGRLHIKATVQTADGKGAQPVGQVLEVQTGERLMLTVSVSGDGNLLGLRPPTLPDVDGMTAELLTKREEEGVTRNMNGMQGTRTWRWMLSFVHPGHPHVPAIAWASFDPFQERFDAQTVGPLDFEVRGAALAAAVTVATDDKSANAAPAVHARDGLRANATEAKLAASDGRAWTQSPLFHALLALPWLALIVTFVLYVLRRRQSREARERQRRAALPAALDKLKSAAAAEPGQGYATTRQVVTTYLAQVAQVEIGGLTEPAVVEELQRRGVPADVARQLAADLQHCDFGRFAPAGDRQRDLAETTERVSQHLNHIDTALVRTPLAAVKPLLLALALAGVALAPHPGHAATLDETFAAANQAYAQHDFATAKAHYTALLDHDLAAAAVHYNLGNTFVQLAQLGRAVAQYQAALQLRPEPALRADILANLQAVRAELTDRARRHHATLHVFDESASLDVIFAQSAPRGLLGVLAILAGLLASGLLAWRLLGQVPQAQVARVQVGIGVAGVVHLAALTTLLLADAQRETLVQAVVVEEDAQLTGCQGQTDVDDLDLPEGLEVRKLAEMADGRVQVRLPNGREGCMAATALEVETARTH